MTGKSINWDDAPLRGLVHLQSKVKKYSASQQRDSNGRWVSDGSTSTSESKSVPLFGSWDDATKWYESKGINLDVRSLKIIGLSPLNMRDVGDNIMRMQAKFSTVLPELKRIEGKNLGPQTLAVVGNNRMDGLRVSGSRESWAKPTNDSTLILTPSVALAIKNPEEFQALLKEHGYTRDTTIRSVEDLFTHELTHVVQNTFTDAPTDKGLVQKWVEESYWSKGGQLADAIKDAGFTNTESRSDVSAYSDQSPCEMWSEVNVLFANPDRFNDLPSEVKSKLLDLQSIMNDRFGQEVVKVVKSLDADGEDDAEHDSVIGAIHDDFGLPLEFWDELRRRTEGKVEKYSPDQQRDSNGRWTSSGGGEMPSYNDLMDMKVVPGPLGSQGGEWRKDASGQKYLMKPLRSLEHGYNEVAAGAVYHVAGFNFPHTTVVSDDHGEHYLVSQKIEGLSEHDAKWWSNHPEVQAEAAKQFGVDALLSHWDAGGMVQDNTLLTEDNKPVTIETGGAMAYRAMGEPKTSFSVGADWGDVESMQESRQGQVLYGDMSQQQLTDSLKTAANLDLGAVQDRWTEIGIPNKVSDKWMAVLEDRQLQLQESLGISKSIAKRDVSDEERDTRGRWTDGGGSTFAAAKSLGFSAKDYPSGHLPGGLKYLIGERKARNDSDYPIRGWLRPSNDKKTNAAVAEELQQRVPMIRMPGPAMAGVVRDNEIKNQYQTGTSRGWLGDRASAELYSLGVPSEMPNELRPVYGYMARTNDKGFEGLDPNNPADVEKAIRSIGITDKSIEGQKNWEKLQEEGTQKIIDNPDDYIFARTTKALYTSMYGRSDGATESFDIVAKNDLTSLTNGLESSREERWWKGIQFYELGDGNGNINVKNAMVAYDSLSNNAEQYGDVQVQLKSSTLDRTTVTWGDSLNTWCVAAPYDSLVNQEVPATMIGAKLGEGGGVKESVYGYVETQVGGAHPTLDDIESVTFTRTSPSSATKKGLDEAGVPYTVLGIGKLDQSSKIDSADVFAAYRKQKSK